MARNNQRFTEGKASNILQVSNNFPPGGQAGVFMRNEGYPEDAPKKVGDIHVALQAQEKQVAELAADIHRLASRLELAIKPPNMQAKNPNGPSPDPVRSPIAEKIETGNAILSELTQIVRHLTEVIEL